MSWSAKEKSLSALCHEPCIDKMAARLNSHDRYGAVGESWFPFASVIGLQLALVTREWNLRLGRKPEFE